MTEARQDAQPAEEATLFSALTLSAREGVQIVSTLGLVLNAFTLTGSAALLYFTKAHPELDAIQSPGGLLLRVLLFGGMTLLCAALLWASRTEGPPAKPASSPAPLTRPIVVALLILLGLIGSLLAFHRDIYPWAAPDEIHHLNVARNLALHGAYASGHPESGFQYFDSFDSVGPAVIAPVALAFSLFGDSLAVARAVMVFFFLLLCGATFQFARRHGDGWSGVIAVALLAGTFSSIYLGRTLYGEVPAFAFLLLGLLAWQRALDAPTISAWGLAAGVLFAGAVLAKTIVVLILFSIAGAWAYDRATHRHIRGRHVLLPAAGAIATLGLWSLFVALHQPPGNESGGTLEIYQHYLLFGVSSLFFAIGNSVALNPVAHLSCLLVALITAPLVFRQRYRPSTVVLYLYALFMLYWWFFFTPGQLHRYLWNSYAILAIFSAPWLVACAADALNRTGPPARRALCLAVVLVMVGPQIRWIALQTGEVFTRNEMAPEREVIAAIAALPEDYRVGTNRGRLPGLMNFFAGRLVETGEDPTTMLGTFDVVVVLDTPENRASVPPGCALKPAGAFMLLSSTKPLE